MPRRGHKKTAPGKGPASPSSIRLNRLLAAAGYGSRRQCDELIEAGRVEVDGQPATKLGTTVDPSSAKVYVDGTLLRKQKLVYYAVNKPIGVVTTNRDPQGRLRVIDLVPNTERVFAVGRLDRNSEGLILLTNDGDLAQQLAHPKFGVKKIYRVTVAGKVDIETMKQMRRGIYISDGLVKVEGAKILKSRSRSTELEIILREGKNREIRRILARLGNKVQHLRRIAIGPLRLGDIPPGAHRPLTATEIRKLKETALLEAEERGPRQKRKSASKRSGETATKKKVTTKKKSVRPPAVSSIAVEMDDSEMSVFDLDLETPTRRGAVIGGEGAESNEVAEKPRRKGTRKKVARKASRSTSSRKKKTAKKGQRGAKKKSTRKKTGAAGKKTSMTNRRGEGRGKKVKRATKKGRRR